MLNVGAEAPLFEAESTKGNVRLADYIGKQPIVLIFYPMDDTPGCTKQLCAVRDAKEDYDRFGALVIGVNAGSAEQHLRFAGKHGFDFPIVADRDESIRKAYDVGKLFGLIAQQRIVYVIDRSGRIAFAAKGNRPTEEILAVLERLQHEERH
ncbi:peroxiredoxin [Paenibacillus sp. 32O-W]|uniref:peroxiredoxin n=1 Tax=Paenibacillus sp. 32O-W TaxID=1695218 RepID=UPI00071F5423|nr:peroxiredoxin [Paenibacillus sp. 32O-W]ALS28976.1 peroxiredoxin [Paenibacillus sp. 32O-W]